jgi:hypothetical protein
MAVSASEMRMPRVVAEDFAQLDDDLHERIVGDCRAVPDDLDEFFFGDESRAVFEQVEQHLKSFLPQRIFFVPAPQTQPCRVNLKVANLITGAVKQLHSHLSAKYRKNVVSLSLLSLAAGEKRESVTVPQTVNRFRLRRAV